MPWTRKSIGTNCLTLLALLCFGPKHRPELVAVDTVYQSQLRTSHFRRVAPRGCDSLFAIGLPPISVGDLPRILKNASL